jgi:hypothetical protein
VEVARNLPGVVGVGTGAFYGAPLPCRSPRSTIANALTLDDDCKTALRSRPQLDAAGQRCACCPGKLFPPDLRRRHPTHIVAMYQFDTSSRHIAP